MDPIRRVVTGNDAEGRSRVRSNEALEPTTLSLLPGFETIEIWHTQGTPSMPDDLGDTGVHTYFPPAGGSVFRVVTLPPEAEGLDAADFDIAAGLREAQDKLPGLAEKLEPDNPGMHVTDSVDYGIVLEGEIELELDDGSLTLLQPGTVVIQRGTHHAWRNRTDRPARIAFVLIGATPAE